MTPIFATTLPRSVDTLARSLSASVTHGQSVEAWLFADAPTRQQAEQKLAAAGINARFHSAYKPLLHYFIEDLEILAPAGGTSTPSVLASPWKAIRITCPRHDQAPENRFLLETYPLAALVGDCDITLEIGTRTDGLYDVELTGQDGTIRREQVFAPNRVHRDVIGETHVSPTGWLRIRDMQGRIIRDEHFLTDYETLFAQTMQAIADHDWGNREPYFEELNITVELPGRDQPLPHGHEAISLHEALHEDFYFSLLEYFQKRSGRPLGDRGLQPGQIVPEIRMGLDALHVAVETRPLTSSEIAAPAQNLAVAARPLSVAQIATELAGIDGQNFGAQSRSGRNVAARYRAGRDFPVMISGGQHPNEITGVAGALRGALALAARPQAHFTISPLENPDGYALHQRLIVDNPAHMHHAARYTALGDDLEYRTGDARQLLEKEIRTKAQDISGAKLHVNLHGYPSHEWTRPLSGYVPRGFGMWTLPKGFFLILRHHADWADHARVFVDRITRHLAAVPGLLAFNNAQIDLYRIHAGETGFEIINGFPCMISTDDRHDVPLTLITEYPDETIYDDPFIAGHTAQMETVIAAYDAHQELMANRAP